MLAAHVVARGSQEWTGNIVPVGQNAWTQGDERDCDLLLTAPDLWSPDVGPPGFLNSPQLLLGIVDKASWHLISCFTPLFYLYMTEIIGYMINFRFMEFIYFFVFFKSFIFIVSPPGRLARIP